MAHFHMITIRRTTVLYKRDFNTGNIIRRITCDTNATATLQQKTIAWICQPCSHKIQLKVHTTTEHSTEIESTEITVAKINVVTMLIC